MVWIFYLQKNSLLGSLPSFRIKSGMTYYFFFPFSKYPVTNNIPTIINTNPSNRVRSWYNPITNKMIPKNMCRLSSRLNPSRKLADFFAAELTAADGTTLAATAFFVTVFFTGMILIVNDKWVTNNLLYFYYYH